MSDDTDITLLDKIMFAPLAFCLLLIFVPHIAIIILLGGAAIAALLIYPEWSITLVQGAIPDTLPSISVNVSELIEVFGAAIRPVAFAVVTVLIASGMTAILIYGLNPADEDSRLDVLND